MTSEIIEILGYVFLFFFVLIVIWTQVPAFVCFIKYLSDKKSGRTKIEIFREYYKEQENTVRKVKIIIAAYAVVIYGLFTIEKKSIEQKEEEREELYKDGYKNGYCIGYNKGYEKGLEDGYCSSVPDGDGITFIEWVEAQEK